MSRFKSGETVLVPQALNRRDTKWHRARVVSTNNHIVKVKLHSMGLKKIAFKYHEMLLRKGDSE